MAAASVTGVGQGSADKIGQKGSEHLFVGVEKLIGTRVVMVGTGTTSSNVLTITLPEPLDGVVADYAIFLTVLSVATSACDIHVTSTTASSGALAAFAVWAETAATTFYWQIVRVNNATVTVN